MFSPKWEEVIIPISESKGLSHPPVPPSLAAIDDAKPLV